MMHMARWSALTCLLLLCACTPAATQTPGAATEPVVTPTNSSLPQLQPTPDANLLPLSDWPIYRHEQLGIELRYPPGWQVDSTPAFVWFFSDPNTSGDGFNVANAAFDPPMRTPVDFLDHLGPPVLMTEMLTLDGIPALLVRLQPVPEAEGFHSVVAVVTSDGRGLTIGGKCDLVVFDQVLTTVRFFTPTNPP